MTILDDEQEANVPAQAVRPRKTEAQRQAEAAGHPVVLVKDGELIRRVGGQVIVLKSVRGRIRVGIQIPDEATE